MLWPYRPEGEFVGDSCVHVNGPAAATGTSGIANNAKPDAATNEPRRAVKEGMVTMLPVEPFGFRCEHRAQYGIDPKGSGDEQSGCVKCEGNAGDNLQRDASFYDSPSLN